MNLKQLRIVGLLVILSACGRNQERTGVSKVSLINNQNGEITLRVGYPGLKDATYKIPTGMKRNYLHGYEINCNSSYCESSILLSLVDAAANRFAYEAFNKLGDDNENISEFADGKKGLAELNITCENTACTINGTGMNRPSTP